MIFIPILLISSDKILATEIIAKHQTYIQRTDTYTPNCRTGIKESYNKLIEQGSHTNKSLMQSLYTKLPQIRNSRLNAELGNSIY